MRRVVLPSAFVEWFGFSTMEPPDAEIAAWLARRLPASAAAYAALASWLDVPIAVADDELRQALRTIPMA